MSESEALDGVTAGALLRQAREEAGLHVSTLAANLKVPVRKLEALEEDRYDLLPDAVFVRALASSVCRSLKVDPQPVLERLPQSSQPRLPQAGDGLGAPFRAPSDGPGPGVLEHVSRPVVLIVLALLLAAVVLIFLPARDDGTSGPATTAEPVMPPPGASPQPGQVVAAPAEELTPAGPAAVAPPAPAPGTAAAPATPGAPAGPATAVAPSATIAAAAPAAVPATPAASAPVANGIVVFRTRGASWIEVTDANGTTLMRRLMAAGEGVGVSGRLPLSVTVGDAAQTEVQVRGKPYDLRPVARDNVARFEVK